MRCKLTGSEEVLAEVAATDYEIEKERVKV